MSVREPVAAVVPSGTQFEITHREQRAVIVEVGGGLRGYWVENRDLLDGYGVDEMCPSGRGQVLIPWPNRLQDGRYPFSGGHHQLALTDPERQDAIHGLVRWAAWTAPRSRRNRPPGARWPWLCDQPTSWWRRHALFRANRTHIPHMWGHRHP